MVQYSAHLIGVVGKLVIKKGHKVAVLGQWSLTNQDCSVLCFGGISLSCKLSKVAQPQAFGVLARIWIPIITILNFLCSLWSQKSL